MWSTLPYLVKVQICFALLWIVYRFSCSVTVRFARSRAYLLLSVPVSFLIPLLSIPVLPASTACTRSGCSGRRGRRSPRSGAACFRCGGCLAFR
ncbi:MAG: hypothetical protein ACLR8Y_07410 [Alistipes indistinctus]